MKRYAVALMFLLAVVGLVTGVVAGVRRKQAMEVRFNKRDLPNHGIDIITSADSQFALVASKYFKDPAMNSSAKLQPFSIFIKNSGTKTIVAYMLVWQLVKSNGEIRTNRTAYSEPGILMGHKIPTNASFKHTQAIEPNAVRCFSWSAPIDAEEASIGGEGVIRSNTTEDLRVEGAAAMRAGLNAELAEATDLTISLDGVFFDDGTFVGPNATGYFEQIHAMVRAKLDLVREVALAREHGKADEAFEAIEAKSRKPDVRLTSESSPNDYYDYYVGIFAREMTGMKGAHGPQRMAAYLGNLYKQPRPSLRKLARKGNEPWTDKD